MKTPVEIIDKIDLSKGSIILAMEKYAKQWIEKASEMPTLKKDCEAILNLKKEIDAQ